MTTLTQPLKWHGGKKYLAKRIIELMPRHLHYVEPFFGGGAVLLARDPNRDWFIDQQWKLDNGENVPAALKGCSEVVNDTNNELMNFWLVLASEIYFDELRRLLEATPFAKPLWDASAWKPNFNPVGGDKVIRAFWFFIRARQSMAGRMDCFTPLTRNRTRGRQNAEANAWWNCIEGLPEIHERLKRVVILNDDACKVIKQQDGENTLFYCDPPYLHETRSSTGEYGEHEMTEDDHENLLHCLSQISGNFILSGYPHPMYDKISYEESWHCVEIEIDNKASSAKKKKKETECLWMNYDPNTS